MPSIATVPNLAGPRAAIINTCENKSLNELLRINAEPGDRGMVGPILAQSTRKATSVTHNSQSVARTALLGSRVDQQPKQHSMVVAGGTRCRPATGQFPRRWCPSLAASAPTNHTR